MRNRTHVEVLARVFLRNPCKCSVRAQTRSSDWSLSSSCARSRHPRLPPLLNVSPNTLRAWERRFGYPKPQRTAGKHRLYTHGEVAALRDALQEGLSISSAISRARESLSADTQHAHRGAAGVRARSRRRRHGGGPRPALGRAQRRGGAASLDPRDRRAPRLRLGAPGPSPPRWATDWLQRAQRMAPPPMRPAAVLVGDATRDDLDPDALGAQGAAALRGALRRPRARPADHRRGRARPRSSARSRRRSWSSRAPTRPTTTWRAGPIGSARPAARCR